MNEQLHFHFSLSCVGEGNGNPLQCSCLENPRDEGNLVGCRLWGSHRVRHDWSDLAAAAAEEKWSASLLVVSNSLWSHRLYSPWNSPGHNTEVGRLSLLQGIFPTKGSNPGLPHCRWILYQLSHKRSPRLLEWVAYPFSSRSSQPRNWTGVSCIAGGFFTNWAIREAWLEEKGAQYPSLESGPFS